ncbi:MAG: GNAT family N-acetyltransferase [Promethearchaeota archaeon]
MKNRKFFTKDLKIRLANLNDIDRIHEILLKNIVNIKNVGKISAKQKILLENTGFLRKEVDKSFYRYLIETLDCDIYVALNKKENVIAFASLYKNQSNIKKLRDSLNNLNVNDKAREVLLNETKTFSYLDQISVLPDLKRKRIGTALIKHIIHDTNKPIVAFVLKRPLANKASAFWHEFNGFKLVGTCDGTYKEKNLEWWVYIHWNN